jgi:Cu/Ag efflux protein CusF
MMKKTLTLLAAALIAATAPVHAQAPANAASAAATTAPTTEGEVRKVDPAAGKLTLRHGRIENLDMPGMTMVFRVPDLGMLDGLKEGDKVRFSAERSGGAITITSIERIK